MPSCHEHPYVVDELLSGRHIVMVLHCPQWFITNLYGVTCFLSEGYVSIDELKGYPGELHDFIPGHFGSSVTRVHSTRPGGPSEHLSKEPRGCRAQRLQSPVAAEPRGCRAQRL